MTFEQQLQNKIDLKTKPLGSLGVLETIAFQIAKVQNTLCPTLNNPSMFVFAGDHGLALEGVSAFPQEVTHQMVLNFLNQGAAINVFCKQNNIALKVVDAGVNFDFEQAPLLIKAKAGYGTLSALHQKALTRQQLEYCLVMGAKVIQEAHGSGCNIVGFGEMGIGNTSSASLIMSLLSKKPISACVGRGTGLDDAQLAHKLEVLEKTAAFHKDCSNPLDVLQSVGGFEIAQICGAMLEAHSKSMIILVDGFIATSAYAIAQALQPSIKDNAIFTHVSKESAHKDFVDYLGHRALMDLELRLGEGTGCALAYPLVQASVNFLNQMASFESAGVSNK
ncbi:nicotinate-nucleotide--dimethylbenzimidazole phosphoribosyltransferase [Myroides sp. LJL115]